MSKNKDNMTPRRWDYIKALGLREPRYLHVSCEARMITNPADPRGPRIPWIGRGVTFRRSQEKVTA
jgi:hypothetical protein